MTIHVSESLESCPSASALYYTGLQMGAVLVGTDGPSRGRLVLLGTQEVSVGRHENNSVAIDDVAASKHHCVIRSSGERFLITDLDSRNGTFVNGAQVRERVLEDNDEIRVGGSVFLFRREHKDEPQVSAIRTTDSIFLNPQKLDETLPVTDRTARGVHVLLRVSQALQVAQTVEDLERHLLQLLFEAVPAERASVVLTNGSRSIFTLNRGADRATTEDPVPLDPDISRQVFEERKAVLQREGDRSFIAAPLVCLDHVEGVLHLYSEAAFDNGHLELVSAVGSIAGVALHNLVHVEQLRREKQILEQEIRIEHDMVGDSQAMRAVHKFIARVAARESTVLIRGESGTGKELVARAIHENSPRKGKPFVAINCAALNENLLESELFGHEKGGFTSAVALKKGMFEVADGGTLFLDEIGELAPGLQAKLLRALETREFTRVGGTRSIRVNVRIVAATNRDLEAAVAAKTFRQDLYFRVNVISIILPPLREHREDIPALANHFARKFGETVKRSVSGVSEKALKALMKYDWEGGNIRELRNAIEHAAVMGVSDMILREDLPESVLEAIPSAPADWAGSYQEAVTEFKRCKVREALERAHGVITEAAKLLDVHPNYLHRLMKNLKLR
ncbi:MAG: sigma 54-interacting transcriptional regulator [Bryobacterales bacterium]|nr:sigma 54-interacting transcriptional regulator [Bryobacterales bacterium]MBV9400480.1 sigma 54-interacting transcriptional regulator [Bryobacterales bacterium]